MLLQKHLHRVIPISLVQLHVHVTNSDAMETINYMCITILVFFYCAESFTTYRSQPSLKCLLLL